MKIELVEGNDFNGDTTHTLYINGEDSYRIHSLSECPEDAIIGRDLVDGNDIISCMKIAYEAGKRGEDVDIIYSKDTEGD